MFYMPFGVLIPSLPVLDIGGTIDGLKSYMNRIKGPVILFCPIMNGSYDSMHGSYMHPVDIL